MTEDKLAVEEAKTEEEVQREAWVRVKSTLTKEEIEVCYRVVTLRAAKFMQSHRYPPQEIVEAAGYAGLAMEHVGKTGSWENATQFKSLTIRKAVWLIRDEARRRISEKMDQKRLRRLEASVVERKRPSDLYSDDGEHPAMWGLDSTDAISSPEADQGHVTAVDRPAGLSDPELEGIDTETEDHFETCEPAQEPSEEPGLRQSDGARMAQGTLKIVSASLLENPDVKSFLRCCRDNPDLLYVDKGHRWRFRAALLAEKLGWEATRVYNVRDSIRDSRIIRKLSRAWHMVQCGDAGTVSEALGLLHDETPSNGR